MTQINYLISKDAGFIGSILIQLILKEGNRIMFIVNVIYNAILNCFQNESKPQPET